MRSRFCYIGCHFKTLSLHGNPVDNGMELFSHINNLEAQRLSYMPGRSQWTTSTHSLGSLFGSFVLWFLCVYLIGDHITVDQNQSSDWPTVIEADKYFFLNSWLFTLNLDISYAQFSFFPLRSLFDAAFLLCDVLNCKKDPWLRRRMRELWPQNVCWATQGGKKHRTTHLQAVHIKNEVIKSSQRNWDTKT